jgi:lipopolysaccharide/colanic/teichoic acid biosynthesis glycosyltransferase
MYDIEYVQKKSFLLDAKILFLTVIAVLRGKGAY